MILGRFYTFVLDNFTFNINEHLDHAQETKTKK